MMTMFRFDRQHNWSKELGKHHLLHRCTRSKFVVFLCVFCMPGVRECRKDWWVWNWELGREAPTHFSNLLNVYHLLPEAWGICKKRSWVFVGGSLQLAACSLYFVICLWQQHRAGLGSCRKETWISRRPENKKETCLCVWKPHLSLEVREPTSSLVLEFL